MAETTSPLSHDPREAAEVDRLIRGLRPFDRKPVQVAAVGSRPPAVLRHVRVPMRPRGVRVCVALGVALAIALPQWPYARDCSWGLLFYLSAAGMVPVAGVWGAGLTWESRLGFSHIVALGTVLWGLILVAQEVLPRVGYARVSATWFCPL